MSREDWLWDGSGTPDPATERLRRALRELPGPPGEPRWPRRVVRRELRRWFVPLAAAAALAMLAGWPLVQAGRTGWTVKPLAGTPRPSGWAGVWSRLAPGAVLETRAGERARVDVADLGWMEVEPGSHLRLEETRRGRHRVTLEHGEIHAFIVAPPREFVVATASAVATDLGCAYRLRVDEAGEGELAVTSGWVAFTHAGLESFVPAGAVCATHAGRGPGTPRFGDAPAALVAALAELDAGSGGADADSALSVVLAAARPRDAFTLWHLLWRVGPGPRRAVAARLATLVPLPPGASLERALQLDRATLDAWWDWLGLGPSATLRAWEAPWSGAKGRPEPR